MKFHSCGAVLYTIYNNKVYFVLGKERGDWFPFKGKCEKGETYEQAAVREIEEETCNLIKVNPDDIDLNCTFSTSRKYYHIGLVFVPYTFIKEFPIKRKTMTDEKCLEKTHIKMFDVDKLNVSYFHQVTRIPLSYYHRFLIDLQQKINKNVSMLDTCEFIFDLEYTNTYSCLIRS